MMSDIGIHQGKDVHAIDAYVVASWMPPLKADPNLSFPVDSESKDMILFPLWKTGHWVLCPMNGPGEVEYGVGALEGVTPPNSLENANMMSSIRKGVEWLKDNHLLMKSKYLLPRIDSMEEADALNALSRLRTHCDTTLDEDDEIRAPLYFTFKNREDMFFFMSEVRDKKNVRVSSFYNPDI
ncbi:uncharacterized protein LOC120492954 isoform X2 [Pimephales promelas]|nr:uncharacterized protein LOC120492954 isoform X2 [Pimephales promelas]